MLPLTKTQGTSVTESVRTAAAGLLISLAIAGFCYKALADANIDGDLGAAIVNDVDNVKTGAVAPVEAEIERDLRTVAGFDRTTSGKTDRLQMRQR